MARLTLLSSQIVFTCIVCWTFTVTVASTHRYDSRFIRLQYVVSPKKTHIRFVYNFDIHEPILIVFGRHVIEKVSSPMVVYFSTQLTSASALPAET